MKNLSVSEKSKGVLLFATNTDTIDYVAIARRAERLIDHYLNLPVTIVTSNQSNNTRYNIDTGKVELWHNRGRFDAYSLSPYDQTILLDSDYLIFDDNLLKILSTVNDYNIVKHNTFVDDVTPKTMGRYSLPTLWATAIVFNKTAKSQMLFDLVARIERNYTYYRKLYNIQASNYRNDYAFTIADNILNGYTQDIANYIPWPIYTVANPIDSLILDNQQLRLITKGQGYVLPKQSLHILSKQYLLSDACERLIKEAINA